jgi:Protein of unknown function (DUF2997)
MAIRFQIRLKGSIHTTKPYMGSMETLEFIIYPDGRVQEKVTGIVGASCTEVTAAIEAQLGQVLHQESTSEYFTQSVNQSATAATQATFSEW